MRPEIGAVREIEEGLNDVAEGLDTDGLGAKPVRSGLKDRAARPSSNVHFGDLMDDENSSPKRTTVLDPEDLEMLGYGPTSTEVLETSELVQDRVFGVDYVRSNIAGQLASADGGLNVDDINASELVMDHGAGISPLRAVSGAFSGFQVKTEGSLRSWSHRAPKVTPPKAHFDEISVDSLIGMMNERVRREQVREKALLRDRERVSGK